MAAPSDVLRSGITIEKEYGTELIKSIGFRLRLPGSNFPPFTRWVISGKLISLSAPPFLYCRELV